MHRKALLLSFLLVVFAATGAFAVGEARIEITITDQDGNPLSGVAVLVEAAENIPFTKTYTSDEKGLVRVFVINGTVSYNFTYTKDGYAPVKQNQKLKLIPEMNFKSIILGKDSVARAPATETAASSASAIYNEGVALFRDGNDADAIAKFEEAINLDPALAAGWIALAKVYAKQEQWDKAIEAAQQSLDVAGDDQDMFRLLANAYTEIGEHDKAKEFNAKLPKSAAAAFNEAVPLLNSGNDDGAEPLLLQAIEIDESFAKAHYELGNLYARKGRNAEAKEHLTRYVDLEPEGENATFAKEMMKYLE